MYGRVLIQMQIFSEQYHGHTRDMVVHYGPQGATEISLDHLEHPTGSLPKIVPVTIVPDSAVDELRR